MMTKQNTLSTHKKLRIIAQARALIISGSAVAMLMGCASTYAGSEVDKPSALTDANIAAIVVGANKIDISAGQIALAHSSNNDIKKFAQLMITDHTAVLNSAVELVTRLEVTPVDNELVATLGEQAAAHEMSLKTLSGAAFDKRYIDHEVAYHEAVIDVIENQLIPAAQNQELKDTLLSVVPAFKAHLKHSQMVQRAL